jgi:hypothetical protein
MFFSLGLFLRAVDVERIWFWCNAPANESTSRRDMTESGRDVCTDRL